MSRERTQEEVMAGLINVDPCYSDPSTKEFKLADSILRKTYADSGLPYEDQVSRSVEEAERQIALADIQEMRGRGRQGTAPTMCHGKAPSPVGGYLDAHLKAVQAERRRRDML